MADTTTPTAGIVLVKPEDQSPGYGPKIDGNFTHLDTMLGTTLAADANPQGSVAGYKNQLISDGNDPPIVWLCQTQGDAVGAVWARLGRIIKGQIIDQRDVWTKPQVSKWVAKTPAGGTIVLDSADDFVVVSLGAAFEIPLPAPGTPFTITDAQIIVLEINQHPTVEYAVSAASGIFWPGGGDPPTPVVGSFGFYTIVKRAGTDIWAGNYALY